MADDLDITVRDHATDRWLSSRFVADAAARADLIALYALDHELTRIPHLVSDPLMGEIRMTWWREGLEEIAEGRPVRPHPVLKAIAAGALPAVALAALAEARLGDLDEPKTGAALIAHIDATEGLVMALAARRLSTEATADHVAEAARAVGLARVDPPAALKALAAARSTLRALPVAAFPAVAHAVFVPDYARGVSPGPLGKRLRVFLAVMTGRT
jgi:15-cis-phytoene synthase